MTPSGSRRLARIVDAPPPEPGFIGPGHLAVEVLAPHDLAASDPFVVLMDDRIDIGPDRPLGGAHPHAGLETVTLVIAGAVHDRDEGVLRAGDALWMTAGRGIIHSENVLAPEPTRVLQLWIALPPDQRAAAPGFQVIPLDAIPIRREPGVEVRLYSGASGPLRSPTRNLVPVTLADIHLAPGAAVDQDLPRSYNGFVYLVDGAARVGDAQLHAGQVGWLDRPTAGPGSSPLRIAAGDQGARLVLYAGEPQNVPIVTRGPFVAGSEQEIARFYSEYRAGKFTRMSELGRALRADRRVDESGRESFPASDAPAHSIPEQ